MTYEPLPADNWREQNPFSKPLTHTLPPPHKGTTMTNVEAKFISSVNWIEHQLSQDLKYGEIQDFKQRLIDTQKQLEKALQDFSDKKTI